MLKPVSLFGKGLFLPLDSPVIMGILNITSDSFYAGSRIADDAALVEKAGNMMAAGAGILDVGAMSSRPGAKLSDPEQESIIIENAVRLLRQHFPDVFISVDTVWSLVAEKALLAGANMINDISAGKIDPGIWDVVAKHDVPYVLMHMKGIPENMLQHAEYEDVMLEILAFFSNHIRELQTRGVFQILLDPGIGFSKKSGDNFTILKYLLSFAIFDRPLMVGISRKSFIYKSLSGDPDQALTGTSILHGIALNNGVHILRVHDVKEAKEAITLVEMLKKG